ncbi:hypothetical protein [Sphingomonas sp. PB4P5]|uniref:hypothetical protein n=1 Tax=Parasphingomonas puruogangriensis TaxID=3096155 RepID=UPI002FCC3BA3
MMAAAPEDRQPPRVTALVVDTDSFEAGYVASVLTERNVAVLGPFGDVETALAAIVDTPPQTAILGRQQSLESRGRLVAALAERGIPYLSLLQSAVVPPALRNHAVLAKPFAGYQVAEWVRKNGG